MSKVLIDFLNEGFDLVNGRSDLSFLDKRRNFLEVGKIGVFDILGLKHPQFSPKKLPQGNL